MDKSWMSKNRLSREYILGVEAFMNFAMQDISNRETMLCPCIECGCINRNKVNIVRGHLLSNGIDLTYRKWIWHGEGPTLRDFTAETDEIMNQDECSFNFDHPIDMVNDAYDEANDPSKFQKLLEDAEKPLYPGCVKFTRLSAVVKLYNLKAKHNWSDKSFNDLLTVMGDMLPHPNELPLSLYDAKKSLVALGMEYEKIHACPNDCILYRKEYIDCTSCPTCGVSRWKDRRKSPLKTLVPQKVLWYFPPIPRFQRMFRTKDISKDLTWHADNKVTDGYMRHPSDSPSWKVVDHRWPEFASETRNLRLALSADGINPHSLMSSTYSCWPVLLVTYNLPPWLCLKRKFIMLTLLIAGPKQPGNDIDVFLAPLIDDLKNLWSVGIECYDAYRDENFLLRGVLLWTINDFPAYGNLCGCKVKGYHSCPVCSENTYAKRLKHSRKMSFTGHRRFLRPGHPYRRQKKAFDGTQEFGTAPRPLTGRDVLKSVADIKCRWGKLKQGKDEGPNEIWKKKSIFFELEYWEHLHVRHVLDVMHIEKNICESLIGTLLDIPGKTKDGLAARRDLQEMNVRTELAPVVGEKRTFLPPACYTLSRAERRNVCESLSRMKVPTGYSSNVQKLVSLKELKLVGLKSHDCHALMQQLLPVALRGVLPDNVRYAIIRLCYFFNVICSKVIDVSKLDEIQEDIVTTLCLLEKYFPPSFFDIMVHLSVHLVREVRLCGPVWYRWMYPFERYMRVLKSYVRNRNRPEGCMAECYIAEEAVEYCANYMSNVRTCGIPTTQNHLLPTKSKSRSGVKIVSDEDLGQAHRHVLANDIQIDPYIEEHMVHLKKVWNKSKTPKWLQDEHNRSFTNWLRDRVGSLCNPSTHQVSDRVKWIAGGPCKNVLLYHMYIVEGKTFYTRERDSVRAVQNSGVSLVAKTMQLASAKDKKPIVSEMVFYGVIEEIWELDYTGFRIPMFKCSWVENQSGIKVDDFGFTLVNLSKIGFKDDSFILASQAKQVFYVEDPIDPNWSVVLRMPSKEYMEHVLDDDAEEFVVHHPSFTKGLPKRDDDTSDESEPPCVRENCDGTWIDHGN